MRQSRRFERTILLLVLAMLGSAWIAYSQETVTRRDDSMLPEAPIVGRLAPEFTLQTPTGEVVALSDFVDRSGVSGRPVVLNYWASWCGPCRLETPQFQSASVKYGNQIAILGINQGEDARTITEFGVSFGLTYPLLIDQDNSVNKLYGVANLPTTIFIDRSGVVREVFVGILNKAVLEQRLGRLLEAKE